MELKKYTTLVFILLSVSLTMAAMNDIKIIVCNNMNITEPSCTIWWDTLNLTEVNFTTNITYTNITIIYKDYKNQTINQTTINNDYLTIKNNTYISYNYTGNISDLNFSYNNTNIKNFITASEIDAKISTALSNHIKVTNSTSIDELEDSLGLFKWAFLILIPIIIIAIVILFMRSNS